MKTQRDYQGWCIDGNDRFPGILPALDRHPSTIAVLATGLGKSFIMANVAKNWTRGNVLFLAHRIELLDQMADTLEPELGYRPTIEQAVRGMDEESMFGAGHVVVGSIQSMVSKRRLKKFRHHPFGLVCIDECHRATSPSYTNLLNQLRDMDANLKLLGVTATPNRTDATAMGLVFDSVAYHMDIAEGIDQGWLVDIHQKFAVVEDLDLSKIPVKKNEFGELDFKPAELESLLTQEGPLHSMSRPVLDLTVDGDQAIIFTASVMHAHMWAAVLNHYRPGCAAAIDGTMPKGDGQPRTEMVRKYKSGDLQFLLNFNIFTEGFDAPNTRLVVFGKPTKSKLSKTQMLGRCTRVLPGVVDGLLTPEARKDAIAGSAKPFATGLDFVKALDGTLTTCSDILGGNYDVDICKGADEIMGAKGGGNVQDALKKAKASMLLEAEEQRRQPLRKAIEGAKVSYYLGNLGPGEGTAPTTIAKGSRGGSTDSEVAALVNLGVEKNTAIGYSHKQAQVVMRKLRQQRCTIPQAKTLERYGYDPTDFNTYTATKQIQEIADAGWKRPHEAQNS